MAIEFFIPIEVLPKQSFRKARHGGYTDKAIKANAEALAVHARKHAPRPALDRPVVVSYTFYFAWAKTHSKKFRAQPAQPKITIPDLGNLEKQMDDVLQLARIVKNDSRIYRREDSAKLWADRSGVAVIVKAVRTC
jgi:Holliday junction resolvase RusA-like endonuclease